MGHLWIIAYLILPFDAQDYMIPNDYRSVFSRPVWMILKEDAEWIGLMDKNEWGYGVYPHILRNRLRGIDSHPNYPLPTDIYRFPPLPIIRNSLAFQDKFREEMELRRYVVPSRCWEYEEVINITNLRKSVWKELEEAWVVGRWGRREKLNKLRNTLGAEMYYGGGMPPIVPYEVLEKVPR